MTLPTHSPLSRKVMLLGAISNIVLLSAPYLLFGFPSRQRIVWSLLFFCGATAFYYGDCWAAHSEPPNTPGEANDVNERIYRRLALASSLVLLTIFWIALIGDRTKSRSEVIGLRLLGAVVLATGVALRIAAIRQLRDQFRSQMGEYSPRKLIDRGIYAWLRHPSESALLLIATGTAIMFCSAAAGGVTLLLLLPTVRSRVRLEDRSLLATFGESYRSYRCRTGGLIPLRSWFARDQSAVEHISRSPATAIHEPSPGRLE